MSEQSLEEEVARLCEQIEHLNNNLFLRGQSSWWRLMLMNLVRGLFMGLGSVIGATLLIYLLIQFLSQINFIPIIGDWATEIVDIIQTGESHGS